MNIIDRNGKVVGAVDSKGEVATEDESLTDLLDDEPQLYYRYSEQEGDFIFEVAEPVSEGEPGYFSALVDFLSEHGYRIVEEANDDNAAEQ